MPAFKFTANVPVAADIKYLDIVPGTYGEQIRLKGKIDGEEAVAYLPGKRDEVLATLIHHGIIANKINGWPPVAEGQKGVDLPPLKRKVQLVSEQPAGQKYGVLKVLNGSGAEQSAGGGTATGTSASAPSVEPPAKPKMRDAYKSLTEWVLKDIAPLYDQAARDLTPEAAASCVATLFIQACKSGKVE